jgi:hypothetical protein
MKNCTAEVLTNLMDRRTFLAMTGACTGSLLAGIKDPGRDNLITSIDKKTLWRNRDGQATTWFHPRACIVPTAAGKACAFMTLQAITGSDYFGPLHMTISHDLGLTWSNPEPVTPLGQIPVPGHDGLRAGVCDVVPEYHAPSKTVLAMGHVVFYRGPKFANSDQLARYPVYAVRRADGTWSERRILKWDDPRGAFIYSNGCGQRAVMADGTIMMSFTFGPGPDNRMVAGVRCSFDGEYLRVVQVGPALENRAGRGLLEPSVTFWRNRFYITLRAEDDHGYVAVSDDGLQYQRMTAWKWDDGEPLVMSTTQQHWLAHSDGLFLVYTRRDASNINVMRWRSPLWMARVDPKRLCLLRDTEQIVLPLVGDGVNAPDDVAIMGNFHLTTVDANQSWVTVGEWMPKHEARGDLLLATVKWARPNRLA